MASGQPMPMQPGEFHSGSQPSVVSFRYRDVNPPSQVYIQRDDQLIVQVIANDGTETVTVNGRTMIAPAPSDAIAAATAQTGPAAVAALANIVPFQLVFPPVGTPFTIVTKSLTLSEGYLLNVSAICGVNTRRGGTFVRCGLQRGATTTWTTGVPLFADYVTKNGAAGWPNGAWRAPTDGLGFLRAIPVSNPAAGTDWLLAVDANTRWRLISLNAQFAAAVAAATRLPQVQLFDTVSATPFFVGTPNAGITSGVTSQVTASTGASQVVSVTTDTSITLPGLPIMNAVQQIKMVTAAIQGADQWSNITVNVEQWMDI